MSDLQEQVLPMLCTRDRELNIHGEFMLVRELYRLNYIVALQRMCALDENQL